MPTSAELETRASAAFTARFGVAPTALGCAPGRVELLGNHTDYNRGLVMAAAIDRFTVALGRPVSGRLCEVEAVNFDQSNAFDLNRFESSESGPGQTTSRRCLGN